MVNVAQLVELRIVVPAVVGSRPIVHPNKKGASRGRAFFFWTSTAQLVAVCSGVTVQACRTELIMYPPICR